VEQRQKCRSTCPGPVGHKSPTFPSHRRTFVRGAEDRYNNNYRLPVRYINYWLILNSFIFVANGFGLKSNVEGLPIVALSISNRGRPSISALNEADNFRVLGRSSSVFGGRTTDRRKDRNDRLGHGHPIVYRLPLVQLTCLKN
jgi:hypothetical protein